MTLKNIIFMFNRFMGKNNFNRLISATLAQEIYFLNHKEVVFFFPVIELPTILYSIFAKYILTM